MATLKTVSYDDKGQISHVLEQDVTKSVELQSRVAHLEKELLSVAAQVNKAFEQVNKYVQTELLTLKKDQADDLEASVATDKAVAILRRELTGVSTVLQGMVRKFVDREISISKRFQDLEGSAR